MILRQRFDHRRAELKPPPPAAANISTTTPLNNPQPPSPARVWAILIGLSVETEKIEVRLTASRYFILFKCTFSPRRIAAGDNATTLPSPGPQTPLIVHIWWIFISCAFGMDKKWVKLSELYYFLLNSSTCWSWPVRKTQQLTIETKRWAGRDGER